MIEKPKLILCDVDGTLRGAAGVVSELTIQTIQKLRNQGIYFGVASGRPVSEVKKYASKWGIAENFDLVIGMNGSEMWDGIDDTYFDYFKLKKDWIKEIYETMHQFHLDINTTIYSKKDEILTERVDEIVLRSGEKMDYVVRKVNGIEEFWKEENSKIMFRVNEVDMPNVEQYFETNPNENYKAFKTQATLIEFSDRRVSKAIAMRKFCELHNIDLTNVVAFGDMTNDKEMIEQAGWGVCLLNGSDDVKAIANDITKKVCDENGFADYCVKHYLTD